MFAPLLRALRRLAPLAIAMIAPTPALAQNIDVSTLPARTSLQLTIYNAEDLTLVRETRPITVRAGRNDLQFSWAGTLIDPTSVSLRVLEGPGEIEIVDTRFPHERSQVLLWTVESERDGEALVEISYFTSGISWSCDYVGVLGTGATDGLDGSMRFDGFVAIRNSSGEAFENASVRLVVGSINLVERVRDLAQRGVIDVNVDDLAAGLRDAPASAKAELKQNIFGSPGGTGGGGGGFEAKDIVKDAFGEYFIFTVPGTESIRDGWSKRMRLFEGTTVPFRTEYRFRPEEYGDALWRVFLVKNDTASSLGGSPLPDGEVRLFESTKDGDGLGLVATTSTTYVPIGREFELNVGEDPEVVLERTVVDRRREAFLFRRTGDQKLFSPAKGDRVEPSYEVVGFDEAMNVVERLRNRRGAPVRVAWRVPMPGDVLVRGLDGATAYDARTIAFERTVPAGETALVGYEVVVRQGMNATQNRVEITP
jgi:hypothetical protein